jgi:hypothetical protein
VEDQSAPILEERTSKLGRIIVVRSLRPCWAAFLSILRPSGLQYLLLGHTEYFNGVIRMNRVFPQPARTVKSKTAHVSRTTRAAFLSRLLPEDLYCETIERLVMMTSLCHVTEEILQRQRCSAIPIL